MYPHMYMYTVLYARCIGKGFHLPDGRDAETGAELVTQGGSGEEHGRDASVLSKSKR